MSTTLSSKSKKFLIAGITFLLLSLNNYVSTQPFLPTYAIDRLSGNNSFINATPDKTIPPTFEEIKSQLPQPFWKGRNDVINCYWKAWQLAFSNLKNVNEKNGFISPYIDPAFSNDIFMWDCSFMTMFGKYAKRAFNFQVTLNNFYAKQHTDGFICRQIREADGSDVFERFDPASTGPNIIPWAEWEYFQNFNDTARLVKIVPVLTSYFRWLRDYRTWKDGTYFSSGWGCGMDNQPRVPQGYSAEFSPAFMSWIDTNLQEIFAGKILLKMNKFLNDKYDLSDIQNEISYLENFVNTQMWEEQQSYYFDKFRDGKLSTVKSIASYWALLADVVPSNRLQPFIYHLENPKEFNRVHRVPSLSADNPYFNPDGEYWKGSIWVPTNYMVLRGLTNCKQDSLAFEIAYNHLNNVVEVFNKTNDLRENYAPDKVQGNDRHNFVGWTGLAPISVLIEYVFGFRADVPHNVLNIDARLLDEYGIKEYPFGNSGVLSIIVKQRKNKKEQPKIEIISNTNLKAIVTWENGKIEKNIVIGKNKI